MKKILRSAIMYPLLAVATLVYADGLPVDTGGGGVSCNPACTTFSCGATICVACNSYGCINVPRSREPGMGG